MKVKLLSILFSLALLSPVKADRLKRADKLFNEMAYYDAITQYLRIVEKNDSSAHVVRNLAVSYQKMNETENAEKYYKMLIDLDSAYSTDYYNYTRLLLTNEKYEVADTFLLGIPSAQRDSLSQMIEDISKISDILSDDGYFKINETSVNTSRFSEFGPAFYKNDSLVFTSSRPVGPYVHRTNQWDGQGLLNLYLSDIIDDGELQGAYRFSKEAKTKLNDGPACFNAEGTEVFTTRNKKGETEEEMGYQLLLFHASVDANGRWSEPEPLPFNSATHSMIHPSLSVDGTTLYFASDIPGGMGGWDIYSVNRTATGWGSVKNMGPEINTPDNDVFPFIADDNTLYFSSKAHTNLGGLDIFQVDLNETPYKVENLGMPVNSSKDDFSFILRNDTGYMATNRASNQQSDDLFKVIDLRMDFNAVLVQLRDSMPVDTAKVDLLEENERLKNDKTKEGGQFYFEIKKDQEYELAFSKAGYYDTTYVLNSETDTFYIKKKNIKVVEERIILMNDILYAFDKWKLPEVALGQVDSIADLMLNDTTMTIVIESHTDCFGSEEYNQVLSEKRASGLKDYLIEKGINETRMEAIGYGESRPANDCTTPEQRCYKEQYRENRRTEITLRHEVIVTKEL